MKIRNATKKDIPQMSILMLDEFRKPPWNEKANLKAVEKSLSYYLETGKAIVAVVEQEIVGILVYRVDQYWQSPVASVEDMAVKGHFQGKRVGKMLLDELEKQARRVHAKKIVLITNKRSRAARFYSKNGFAPKKKVIYLEKKI